MFIWTDIDDLAKIIAALVREGLTFEAQQKGSRWLIELTGGF
jgi:hypothetical protein